MTAYKTAKFDSGPKFLLEQLNALFSVVRLKPFDTSTMEGRSSERLRRVFWTATTSVLAKCVNILTMLVTVPIALSYLGNERFGLWMAITSLIAFLGFADLGIGNVLLNFISEFSAKNDNQAAKQCVSSASFMLILVSVALSIFFVFIYPYVDWNEFFNVSSSIAKKETGPAVAVFVACFIVNLPLNLVHRIQMGYQEGYVNSICLGISNIIGLAAILLVIYLEAGLPLLVMAAASIPLLGNLLNGIRLFGFQRQWLIPRWKHVNFFISKKLVWIGFFFLLIQTTNAVTLYADNIIIAKILGPEAVTNYAVPSKLFTIVPMLIWMFLAPLWPAFGEAYARGDNQWVKTTLVKVILTTFVLSALPSFFFIAFGAKILYLWTGSQVSFSFPLMLGLGVWTIISSGITSMVVFLNAMDKISFQAIFAILTAFISTLAKIISASAIGLPGIAWSNVAASGLLMLIPYSIYLVKRFAGKQNYATQI